LKGKNHFGAKIIPSRGAWIELDSEHDGAIYVRIDRKRKFPVTSLLRVLGVKDDKSIKELFKNREDVLPLIETSLTKDHAKTVDESYIEIYKRLRDGDLATSENAREFIDNLLSSERYDLSKVGRHRFNFRFEKAMDEKALAVMTLKLDDIVTIIGHIVELNLKPDALKDDVDHLASRRVRYVGELLQQKVRFGLTQIKRNIMNRMSTIDTSTSMPIQLISPRPLQARIKEFFTTNQLSQFMSQENILAELEHLRRVSALGPGGLTRERAGTDVRNVHPSHYGRICPIHTPEGQNIGLVLQLSTYARINNFGLIETPYAVVKGGKITKEIQYLNALEEEQKYIAHAATLYDEKTGKITNDTLEVRQKGQPVIVKREEVDYIDVATEQAFSVSTSMIPFLNHDDANRALMGSNMQKQATPCIVPEAPFVATGIEDKAALDTGRVIVAPDEGTVTAVDAMGITFKTSKGKEIEYKLAQFSRTNQFTAFHQRPTVDVGQKLKRGDVMADTSTSVGGQMALGQNVLIAFMTWAGANYEDAIIVSERLVKDSKFTTIHIEEFVINVRDTKLGPEVTTHDIPNVGEGRLKNLDV
jgi:DNA-directed RNA polymerase subunit beta